MTNKEKRFKLIERLVAMIMTAAGTFVFTSDKKEYVFSSGKNGYQMTAGNIGAEKVKTYVYGKNQDDLEKSIVHKFGYCPKLVIKENGKAPETINVKEKKAPAAKVAKADSKPASKKPASKAPAKEKTEQELVTA